MPEIPLSVGSKLELYTFQSRISVNLYIHSRICPRMHNWREGASQPSRTTGTIFLYMYILDECLILVASSANLPVVFNTPVS